MHYIFFILFFAINITAWAANFNAFASVQKFLNDKEDRGNNLPSDNFLCALEINDLTNLREFLNLDRQSLSTIQKITISVSNAKRRDLARFKTLFHKYSSDFTNLTVFICSGLRLGDNFAETLTKIPKLTQVDLMGAWLTNKDLLALLKLDNLVHINVSNNLSINQGVITEIARMDKTFNNLFLVLTGTSVNITTALATMTNKGIDLFQL